jgi:hypothetical protein
MRLNQLRSKILAILVGLALVGGTVATVNAVTAAPARANCEIMVSITNDAPPSWDVLLGDPYNWWAGGVFHLCHSGMTLTNFGTRSFSTATVQYRIRFLNRYWHTDHTVPDSGWFTVGDGQTLHIGLIGEPMGEPFKIEGRDINWQVHGNTFNWPGFDLTF